MAVQTPIYLDYQATTPLDPRVREAMMPFLGEKFGNPHSVTHRFGWEAEASIDVAREQIAELIGADPREIIFTSGATESNNLAIKGVAERAGYRGHIVSVVTEHKCLIESVKHVAEQGVDVTWLPVSSDGYIDLDTLRSAIRDDTLVVSVMAANNEIGVIQRLADIGEICTQAGVLFHSDAAQAFGKIPLNVDAMLIDLMSISGHKIYGPKGIGILYARRRQQAKLRAQIDGGGQQWGLRSGTLAPSLCVGIGKAAELAGATMEDEAARLNGLSSTFLGRVESAIPETVLNGDRTRRIPGNLNLSLPGLDGDLLISKMRDLAISSGAACASATTGPSYVLQAIGLEEAAIKASLRIGFGRFTTAEEMDHAAAILINAVADLGGLKP